MTLRREQRDNASIGPIGLSPGVTRLEVFVFLFVAGIGSALAAFTNVMQPYVFTEILNIPVDRQGLVAGQLMTMQQAVVLICVTFAGVMADRIGRKVLLVFALAGYAISAFVFPLASSVFMLFVIRIVLGVVSSAHTASVPPKLYDYPQNASRGKFMAMVMIFFGAFHVVLIGVVGGRVPGWLDSLGISPSLAGTYALWGGAAVGLVAAVVAALFMMDDRPVRITTGDGPRQGVLQAGIAQIRSFARAWKEVAAEARTNRRFGILLLTSFVVRTDEAVVASFFALWILVQGAQEGLTSSEALVIAGVVTALIRGTAFVVPPILGILLDRHSRLAIYVSSLVMVGIAFLSSVLVPSVTGWSIYALAIFIGLTENAQTISQQAFFGQEAPEHLRGTSYGILAFFGTGSVVVISLVAGYMFDEVGPTAPFALIGGLHILFSLLALLYVRRSIVAERQPTDDGA